MCRAGAGADQHLYIALARHAVKLSNRPFRLERRGLLSPSLQTLNDPPCPETADQDRRQCPQGQLRGQQATAWILDTILLSMDKAQTVPRDKVGGMIGRLHEDTLVAVDRALAVFFGIA